MKIVHDFVQYWSKENIKIYTVRKLKGTNNEEIKVLVNKHSKSPKDARKIDVK